MEGTQLCGKSINIRFLNQCFFSFAIEYEKKKNLKMKKNQIEKQNKTVVKSPSQTSLWRDTEPVPF